MRCPEVPCASSWPSCPAGAESRSADVPSGSSPLGEGSLPDKDDSPVSAEGGHRPQPSYTEESNKRGVTCWPGYLLHATPSLLPMYLTASLFMALWSDGKEGTRAQSSSVRFCIQNSEEKPLLWPTRARGGVVGFHPMRPPYGIPSFPIDLPCLAHKLLNRQ